MSDKPNIFAKEATGEIHFNGDINQESMSSLIEKLLDLETKILKKCRSLKRKYRDENDEEEDKTYVLKVEPVPIKLYITSHGGLIYQVFSAIDTIKNMRVPVDTYVKGFAASAATMLSLAGKRKYITKNSYMLIHELRGGSWGKYSQLKDAYENQTILMEHILDYYTKNTKITREELEDQLKRDAIWNPDKCVEKGLVDEIV